MTAPIGSTSKARNYKAQAAILLAIALFCIFVPTLALDWAKPRLQQLLHPGSKLAWGEERISHIPGEFERRSPLFAASWEMFKACVRVDGCESAPALAMRDQAIRLAWPAIFDRLIIRDDWGEYEEVVVARDDFFEVVVAKGEDTLRNKCVPKIRFWTADNYISAVYRFEGFVCT